MSARFGTTFGRTTGSRPRSSRSRTTARSTSRSRRSRSPRGGRSAAAATPSSSRSSAASCARARSARSTTGAPSTTSAASRDAVELRGSDLALVTEQLGRPPLTDFSVVARCGSGHPLVIRNHPVDRAGKPFPTLYWLTCPDAVKAVSRLEAEGWIKRLGERRRSDPAFGSALEAAHREYAAERGRGRPDRCVGGRAGGADPSRRGPFRPGGRRGYGHELDPVAGGLAEGRR